MGANRQRSGKQGNNSADRRRGEQWKSVNINYTVKARVWRGNSEPQPVDDRTARKATSGNFAVAGEEDGPSWSTETDSVLVGDTVDLVSLLSSWKLRIWETSATSWASGDNYETVPVKHVLELWCSARTVSSTSPDRQAWTLVVWTIDLLSDGLNGQDLVASVERNYRSQHHLWSAERLGKNRARGRKFLDSETGKTRSRVKSESTQL